MDKQIIIDDVDVTECRYFTSKWDFNGCGHVCKGTECKYKRLWYKKQLKAKERECEELKEKVKKYGEINEQETKDYAELKAENEELIRRITKIFACLIKANRTNKIVDTLWVDNITTLWDYIALTLGTEGDQVQIEKQILQKISECEVKNE